MSRTAFAVFALFLLTIAIYGQTLAFDFVNFDDPAYVYNNADVRRGLDLENVVHTFASYHVDNYIPLTRLSYLVEHEIFGLRSGAYHATNALLHFANAVLLLLLLRVLTDRHWTSVLVAVIFVVHPLHVESVAWVAERKDVLSTFFGLLAMIAYASYARNPRAIPYLVAVALFTLSLMAKPMLVTLPCVLLLIDYWPLNRFPSPSSGSRSRVIAKLVSEKAPFLIVAGVFSIVAYRIQHLAGAVAQPDTYSFGVRAANAIVAYASYLGKTVWPVGLIPYYPHVGSSIALAEILFALAVLLAVTIFCVALIKNHPYLLIGWLWFLGTLVPVIGLVQVGSQAMADRYAYFPHVGLFIGVVWALAELVGRKPALTRPVAAIACVVVAVFTFLAWQQTGRWRDSFSLFEYTVEVSPDNATALGNLGEAHYQAGNVDTAIRYSEHAVRVRPHSVQFRVNLALAYLAVGRHADAEAQMAAALKVAPESPRAHNFMGVLRLERGRIDEAQAHLERALAADPDHLGAHNNLGMLLLFHRNRHEEAKSHFRFVLDRDPFDAEAHANMGTARILVGDYGGAIERLRTALELNPRDPDTTHNLAYALEQIGDLEGAREAAQRALDMDPEMKKTQDLLRRVEAGLADRDIR